MISRIVYRHRDELLKRLLQQTHGVDSHGETASEIERHLEKVFDALVDDLEARAAKETGELLDAMEAAHHAIRYMDDMSGAEEILGCALTEAKR